MECEKLTEQDIKRLTDKARPYFAARCELYADHIGVSYNRIAVRRQKTRWGSCSSKGNINLNVLLMLAPIEVIDYVIIHELCHRKQMNHSAKFWALVEEEMPDYRIWKKWLRDNGSRLISMLPARESENGIFYTYILRCRDGSLYTGYTNNLEKRLAAHNSGNGAKYTRNRRPVALVYYETYASKSAAMRREAMIKQLNKRQKERLVKGKEVV